MAGLTASGFEKKTVEEVKATIEGKLRAEFPSANFSDAFLRNLIDAVADEVGLVWEASEAVYQSQDPSRSTGDGLEAVSELTGTIRDGATRSTVTATVSIDPGTYAAESLVAHVDGDPDRRFRNREAVENTGGAAADVEALFESEDKGSIAAPSGTLTKIAEPVSGWNSVTNAEDAVQGSDEETDAELRQRRNAELSAQGTSPLDALRSQVEQLEGMIQVKGFENVTDSTNAAGVPPHSIEMVVWDGTDGPFDVAGQDIADAIWKGKAGGIKPHGGTSVEVEASDGTLHDVGFTRAEALDTWIEVDLTVDPDTYAGDDAVEEALADEATERQRIGDDVVAIRYACAALEVAGVLDVTELRLGFSASPTGTANLSVGDRQIAAIDTSRITVATS